MELKYILILVLAAFLNSLWNLLAKKSLDKQTFFWLALVVSSTLFLVPFLGLYQPLTSTGWLYVALSGGLEAFYFLILGKAYQQADLSLVYPIARGSAPICVTAFAVVALGEAVSLGGLLGILLVVAGILVLHLKALDRESLRQVYASLRSRGSLLALGTGATIATYSVVDKAGVVHVPPHLYVYLLQIVPALLLAPYFLRQRREAVEKEWQRNRRAIVAVGILFVATYLLVLTAMTQSKVSYVASVREVSVVMAALMGTLVLREPFGQIKVTGAVLIFAGVALIALAR